MFQDLDDLRAHFMHVNPNAGAHEAHILAIRFLDDAYLDAPTDIRLIVTPVPQPLEIQPKK